MLLIRHILFATFAINVLGENSYLLTIALASLLILTLGWAFHGVYKKQCLNILESAFVLNLGFLSAAVGYAEIIGWSTKAVTSHISQLESPS